MSSTTQRGIFDADLPADTPNSGMFDPDIFDTLLKGAETREDLTVFVHGTGDITTLVHGNEDITVRAK